VTRSKITSTLLALGLLAGGTTTLLTTTATSPASAQINQTGTRLVLGVGGAQPNGEIYEASTSPNRRFLVFTSDASNLVAGDTNGAPDVFVKDNTLNTVTRVSVLADGSEADAASYEPSISDNGQYVAFTTDSDLFDQDNDFNFASDVYVVNRDANNNGVFDEYATDGAVTTTRMSVGNGGQEADFGGRSGKISGDGKWVAFVADDSLAAADTNSSSDVYVRATDPAVDNTRLVSGGSTTGGGGGDLPAISQTGRYITFATSATDVVPGEAQGGLILRDRDTNNNNVFDESGSVANEHINKSTAGTVSGGSADDAASASISPTGSCVAFKFINGSGLTTDAGTNSVYVRDRVAHTTTLASKTLGGLVASEVGNPTISPDCHLVGFDSSDSALAPFDASIARDVYVKNMTTNQLDRVSAKNSGVGGLSATGTSENRQVYDDGATLLVSSATQMAGADGGNGFRDPFLVTYQSVPTCTPAASAVSAATKSSLTVTIGKCAANTGAVPTSYAVKLYSRTSATPVSTQNVAASATTVTFTGLTAGSLYRFKTAGTTVGGSGPDSAYSGFGLPPFKTLNAFTTQQFTDMAGRAPTSAELTAWSTALTNGSQTGKSYAVTAANFANWIGNNAAFTRLYQVSYGALPSITEFNSRTAALRVKTTAATKQAVLDADSTAYSGTASWKARYPAADTNTTFTTKVFTNAGVAASASRTAAINAYVAKLNAHTITRPGVISAVTGYVTTNSGQSLVVAAQASLVNVEAMFTGMLRRMPTAAEVTTWKPQSTTTLATQALANFILTGASYDARIP